MATILVAQLVNNIQPKPIMILLKIFHTYPLEDEMHFLLKCPLYDAECLILITKIKFKIPNIPSLPREEQFKMIQLY